MNQNKNKRNVVLNHLIENSKKRGYLTADDIIDVSLKEDLPIGDVDWLSNTIALNGIIIYDDDPFDSSIQKEQNEFEDYSHCDYADIFKRVVDLDNSLKPFIEQVKLIKPPQYREFNQLKYLAKEGNRHARQRIIEMYLRNAIKIALNRAEAFDYDISDSIDLACIGLVKAVNKYDPDSCDTFSSYVSLRIYQSICSEQSPRATHMYYPRRWKEAYFEIYPHLKKQGCIKCKDFSKCKKVKGLINEKYNLSREQIKEVIKASTPNLSLDNLVEIMDESEMISSNTGSPRINYDELLLNQFEDSIMNTMLRGTILDVLSSFKKKEREIIISRYGLEEDCEPQTLEQVGRKYGVTRERIRQIEKKSIEKLSSPVHRRQLRDFY